MGKLIVFKYDMPKNALTPRGNFADIFLLIVQLKLQPIRDVCTLYVRAFV